MRMIFPHSNNAVLLFLLFMALIAGSVLDINAQAEVIGSDWSYGTIDFASDAFPCVAGIGDVNADGYDDFVISDPGYESGGGKVMLWTGNDQGLSDTPVWQCTQGLTFPAYTHLWLGSGNGTGVVGGDINGDGINDLVIGASHYRTSNLGGDPESSLGAVLVWYGGADTFLVNATADMASWVGRSWDDQENSYLGTANAVADVNGDGYGDVFSAAPYAFKVNSYSGGGIFGWYSSEAGANGGEAGYTYNADWVFSPLFERQNIGTNQGVAFAGDLDGDGYGDLAVTAYHYSYNSKGEVFIFCGGPSGLSTTADWYYQGGATAMRAGVQARYAGDLNADGYDDFVVTSRGISDGTDVNYAILVWYGGPDFFTPEQVTEADADWSYSFPRATTQTDQFVWVAAPGDITGDGYSDLFWANSNFSNNISGYLGKFFVHAGSPSGLASQPERSYEGIRGRGFLGRVAGIIGDVDGNGCADYAYSLGEDTITIHVSYGSPIPPSMEQQVFDGDEAAGGGMNQAGRTGTHVADIGDVNGDGFGDMMIGSPGHDTAFGEDAGKVDIYYGTHKGFGDTPDLTLTIPDDVISEYWARFGHFRWTRRRCGWQRL